MRAVGGRAPTFALVLFPPLVSAAGQVKGRVAGYEKLTPPIYAEAQRSPTQWFGWRVPWMSTARFPLVVSRDVCVVAISTKEPSALDPVLVRVTGGRTTPSTLVVAPNTKIVFKNVDPFAHDLILLPQANWSRGVQASGGSREWTPLQVGTYELRDELFSSVRTHIVVERNIAGYVYPSARDGSFQLTLPPGEYALRAYFAGAAVSKLVAGVHVEGKGPAVELKEPIVLAGGDTQ